MTTKRTPATPLPWQAKINVQPVASYPFHALAGETEVERSRIVATTADDVRYAVHAANAYSKLVGALRQFLNEGTEHTDETAREIAHALLRELGEEA